MLGDIISAGASLLGGIFKGNREEKNAKRQEQLQREFAQSGIQWKVQDARKAGIHPLYALGANTHSYAPQQIGGSDYGISAAGQHLGRALNATSQTSDRAGSYQKAVQGLSLDRMKLENQLLASKIATVNQGSQPSLTTTDKFVIDGQPGSGLIKNTPLKRVTPVGEGTKEPGAVSDIGYTKSKSGYPVVMSSDAKQRLEDDFIGMLSWNIRNRLLPTLGFNRNPPYKTKGQYWDYHPIYQEYRKKSKSFKRRF